MDLFFDWSVEKKLTKFYRTLDTGDWTRGCWSDKRDIIPFNSPGERVSDRLPASSWTSFNRA